MAGASHHNCFLSGLSVSLTALTLNRDTWSLNRRWMWDVCVDNLHIIECAGNHFDVMLPNDEGGDLTHAIVPFMGQQLEKWWGFGSNSAHAAAGKPASAAADGGGNWIRGMWGVEEVSVPFSRLYVAPQPARQHPHRMQPSHSVSQGGDET